MSDFERIEEARERWTEGGTDYEEWRERIQAEEDWPEEDDDDTEEDESE